MSGTEASRSPKRLVDSLAASVLFDGGVEMTVEDSRRIARVLMTQVSAVLAAWATEVEFTPDAPFGGRALSWASDEFGRANAPAPPSQSGDPSAPGGAS